ncbi:MAG: glycosyltransferase family 2 protein [Bacteroidales bacterium]|nr:glycosyltransferase family 2 protein [Bacteroidales bacterium]
MAELLPRCLDSLLAAGAPEPLEVIVVNDGSRDGSLQVMRGYEARFPGTVVVIDKPNGNYGSTINAALPVARGKYVKILDSDDWFDPQALTRFLECLSRTDADVAVTHFTVIHADGSKELAKYNLYGREPYRYGEVYDYDTVLADGHIRFFLMHSLCYRTQMLLDNGYRQTEGVSYTDLEWDTYPLFYARSIVFFDLDLYQYNMAREGQTMDPKVLFKSLGQMETVTGRLIEFYENWDSSRLSPARKAFIDAYYRNRARVMLKCHLLDIPREQFDAERFAPLYQSLTEFCRKHQIPKPKLYPENKLVRIDACAWWERKHRRYPAWLEAVNHTLDIIMTWLYRKIFR